MNVRWGRGGTHIAIGCVAYVALLSAVRHAWPNGIFFYQGLSLVVVTAVVQFALVYWCHASPTPGRDTLISLLLSYAFMFTVPTTVDRAYSVRLLTQLESHPGGMTTAELEEWFAEKFAADGVRRRLEEQVATGSIVEQDGKYRLTRRGRCLVSAFVFVQRAFATHSASD